MRRVLASLLALFLRISLDVVAVNGASPGTVSSLYDPADFIKNLPENVPPQTPAEEPATTIEAPVEITEMDQTKALSQNIVFPNGTVLYAPGHLNVVQNGLLMSQGLTSRRLATKNQKVLYADGTESERDFHESPDGAAVFSDPETGGYIYVSNSELQSGAGVGALTFNADGNIVEYKWLLGGTRMNCAGGPTWWGTWVSCEEFEEGQIWEVDPWGIQSPRQTILGGDGSAHESFTYDNRNTSDPKFYITTDLPGGPIVRFSPDRQALANALETSDYSELLHSNETGTAKIEYLLLYPIDSTNSSGTYNWTSSRNEAKEHARQYFPQCEGIDVVKNMLYFTCKIWKQLFILDLDNGTFEQSSTDSGAFDGMPDQVAFVLDSEDDILYFCEHSAPNKNGVHGRDSEGRFFTILEHQSEFVGETTGLVFSPDNMRMYVAFQQPGILFEITRTDGLPFGGQKLDILYHTVEGA